MTELDWSKCSNPHLMLQFLAERSPRRGWFASLWSRTDQRQRRRLLLFALACCRRVEQYLADPRCRQALETAERYADRQATRQQFKQAAASAAAAALDASSPRLHVGGWLAAAQARAAEAVAAALNEADCANVAAARAKDAVRAAAKGAVARTPKPASDSAVLLPPPEVSFSSPLIITGAMPSTTPAPAPPPPPPSTSPPSEEDAWGKEALVQSGLIRDIFGNPFRAPLQAPAATCNSEIAQLARQIYQERRFDRMPEIAAALSMAGCDDAELLAHCREANEHVRGCWVIDLLLGKN